MHIASYCCAQYLHGMGMFQECTKFMPFFNLCFFFHSFRELPDLAYNSYIRTIAKILDRVFRPFTMFRVNFTITKYVSLFFHQLLYLLQFCLLYQKLVILAHKLIIDFSNSGSIMGNIVNELS